MHIIYKEGKRRPEGKTGILTRHKNLIDVVQLFIEKRGLQQEEYNVIETRTHAYIYLDNGDRVDVHLKN